MNKKGFHDEVDILNGRSGLALHKFLHTTYKLQSSTQKRHIEPGDEQAKESHAGLGKSETSDRNYFRLFLEN